MTAHAANTEDNEETWHAIIDELTSGDSDSALHVGRRERAYLELSRIVLIHNGFTLIATSSEGAKTYIEKYLVSPIREIIERRTGFLTTIGVVVDEGTATPQRISEAPQAVVDQTSPRAQPAYQLSSEEKPEHSTPTAVSAAVQAPRKAERDAIIGQQTMLMGGDNLAPLDATSARPRSESSATDHNAGLLNRDSSTPRIDEASNLNERYTFDNYVVSDSNKLPTSAAIAVAEKPARAYNPLFVWGDSGLGKTHLMHAIGNYARQLHPALKVRYVSSEEFTNDYINSVRDDRQESFKRRYRSYDILMVDDIQFLQGKEGTQEEFFHTFNALQQSGKQIVLSSDRPPKQLTTLEDRLRTRFQAGLIADIYPPDLETRIAILEKKAQAEGVQASRDVLELIASRFTSSIRELEGAFIRVAAFASLTSSGIDIHNAEAALCNLLPDEQNVQITAQHIQAAAAEYFNFEISELLSAKKSRPLAHARQLAMYLCREFTELSLPQIGQQFGGRDHSTVVYAEKKIRQEITQKRQTYDEIEKLTALIKKKAQG
ncbi:chromosomal replication initiator protein DnaA [Corynebacterium sp. ES2794-CONJ1]|uniref:chromosomal replication initiator protein DnaA n=1 Tax=unclassified Corynebacterium TaxID=2624378 RepID=UPI0021695AF1|nr:MULTISPECIES: chromosomal replication initiator protein DnaA [unclassified Corynebacterium]MCS4490453.1 chromosomal replication initiator protein DnaA [Corynebacterium sp. ES2775-CONJ]MCS4532283.1 chromosomal replication initiator protein DnaA [Corynebacterium sp. ES2730-CONJ]MCU9519752.1 chromosomal replication initiator protein DnaA [Corynebacterium sp. ES2794-CONJ1]